MLELQNQRTVGTKSTLKFIVSKPLNYRCGRPGPEVNEPQSWGQALLLQDKSLHSLTKREC